MKRKIILLGCCAVLAAVVGCSSKDEQKDIPVAEQSRRLYKQLRDAYIGKGMSDLQADGLITALKLSFAVESRARCVPDAIRATLIYDCGVEPCIKGSKEFQVFRRYLDARRVKGEFDETQRDRLMALTASPTETQKKVAVQLEKYLEN